MSNPPDQRDWVSDFDHSDPAYNQHLHEIWTSVRQTCPMAHSKRYGGIWLPLTEELIRAIAYDTEHFSNHGAVISSVPASEPAPIGSAPPITSDPPFHGPAKRLLLPAFAPDRVEKKADEIAAVCAACLDDLGPVSAGDVIDAAQHYAQHIPTQVMSRMLGVPSSDEALMRRFVHELIEGVNRSEAEQRASRVEVDAYLDALIADHRRHPRGSLTDDLIEARLEGEPLPDRHIRGMILLLLMAGIDTTWSAIGSGLWHFATHPEDLERMGREPSLWPTALEELLRAYAPVTMGRVVARDVDLAGHQMSKGDWVLLPFPAANRDPAAFPDADRVILDRKQNRHVAFGLGIHRCIGSNLARLEIRIALETFIRRFPVFSLADPHAVRWSVGQVRGPRQLPLRIDQDGPAPAASSSGLD
jgi:cytochrome P450